MYRGRYGLRISRGAAWSSRKRIDLCETGEPSFRVDGGASEALV